MTISMLGIDIVKNTFQLHGADDSGKEVHKKRLARRELAAHVANLPTCTVVMEACVWSTVTSLLLVPHVSNLLLKIPGVGKLTATAVVAPVPHPGEFRNGRHMSAWLGLVPRQSSSGDKQILLGISKRGDRYLRK